MDGLHPTLFGFEELLQFIRETGRTVRKRGERVV